jgi:hypothetical protein
LAYGDEGWKIGYSIASAVSHSLWHNFMTARDYQGAEEVIGRLMTHPGYDAADRHEFVQSRAMLATAQLAQGDQEGAARRLQELIECGPYSPGRIAFDVFHILSLIVYDLPEDETPHPALVSLALRIATSRRATKAQVSAIGLSTSLDDLHMRLAEAVGFLVE